MGADQDRHLPGRMHPNGGAFVEAAAGAETARKARWREAACLDIGRKAKAAEFSVAFRGCLALCETRDVARDQRTFKATHLTAGIIFDQHWRLVRRGFLRNDAAPAPPSASDPH